MFPRRIQEEFRRFSSSARDLIDGFLTLDPKNRTSAKDALDSDYFWEDPMPCLPRELPKYEPSHEYQTRKRHRDSTKQEVKLPTDQKFLTQGNFFH